MEYNGEHLLIGQIGMFLTLLAFFSALVAAFSNFRAAGAADAIQEKPWQRLARVSFILNVLSVIGLFVTLYLIIYNHYFEYKYAHQHSKRSLDVQYLLSCFWEGQEGSFMLWAFWNAVLGLLLIRWSKKWEYPVMAIMSMAQVFLATFLIGIYFFDIKIGSNPFVLMRSEFPDAPIFRDPDYLTKYITDGNGLNILLQNYWMVIHPPILFLGFASSIVPYAYVVAGLWKKDHSGWLRPAMPWALFCAGILGLGIMMGAAWAYESLTFGGYWAWDPVENASMVPWLLLVAGIHTMLIYKSTGHSLKSSYLFIALSHLLVLYSTFLTRTGVLGDTSVHSFTGEGSTLYWHLIIMQLFFIAVPIYLYYRDRKNIPVVHKEESMNSREFWMFVGSLLLLISAVYIIVLTSLPFINKLFGTSWAIGENVEYVYNRIMILVAILLGALTGCVQYFKYKDTSRKYIWSKLLIPTIIAVVLSAAVSIFGEVNYDKFGLGFLIGIHVALWTAIYTIVTNASYLISVMKWKWKAAGASITHVGFGMMLLGILISSSKKELISKNAGGIAVTGLKDAKGRDEDPLENVTLLKGVPVKMGKYVVTYYGDSTVERSDKVFFNIRFIEVDENDSIKDAFTIMPNAFLVKSENNSQLSSNPGSRHYVSEDIFVYITSWLNPDSIKDTTTTRFTAIQEGDTVFYSKGFIVINKMLQANKNDNKDLPMVDSAWVSEVTVESTEGYTYKQSPALMVRGGVAILKNDTIMEQRLVLSMRKDPASGKVQLGIREPDAMVRYITLKAYRFPWINVLWIGTIVMVLGFMISVAFRIRSKLYMA
ncbi:MAG: cytochrome c assembly protein [Bacteroidetes bacterium]|nr:cytochrome c assembly protein [Bacteroidota bacterium]